MRKILREERQISEISGKSKWGESGWGHVWLRGPARRPCGEEAGRAAWRPRCGRSLLARFFWRGGAKSSPPGGLGGTEVGFPGLVLLVGCGEGS